MLVNVFHSVTAHNHTPALACSLASKLKTAQVTRERHLQLQEKTIIQTQAREYDNLFADKLEQQRQQAIIAEDEKQHLRRMDNFKAREKLEVSSSIVCFTLGRFHTA